MGTEDGDEEHIPHALFTELDEICLREGEDAEWKETARYAAAAGAGQLCLFSFVVSENWTLSVSESFYHRAVVLL